jgi:hypothetical protein
MSLTVARMDHSYCQLWGGTWKEHRRRSGSKAKCDDPREALGPYVLSESAALSQVETKHEVSRQGV